MEFRNVYELYNRLAPALRTKTNELKALNINISEKDIWESLKITKWVNGKNLTLYDMVNDILNYNIECGDVNERKVSDN